MLSAATHNTMTPYLFSPSLSPISTSEIAALPPLTPDPSVEAMIAESSIYCYSVDYRTGRFRYVSPGISRLLGYDAQKWQFSGPKTAFQYVHPEDQSCLQSICREITRELSGHPVGQRAALSFAFTCRVKDASGQYVHLNHQLSFPRFTASGLPLTDFTVVSDISALHTPHPCMLHVRRVTNGKTETLRTRVFTCAEAVKFSRREIEVLELVAQGCSSQEVGKRLFISYNTVCTHRKNLMKKAEVKGTVDLLRFARVRGFIR